MTEHDFQILKENANFSFTVYGKPKPQARPRFGRYGNVYSPKNDWYYSVLNEAKKNKPKIPIDKPIKLFAFFGMPKLKKYNGDFFHTKKPDADNLIKAIKDAMKSAGILKDDSLIWNEQGIKIYADMPRCEIYLWY